MLDIFVKALKNNSEHLTQHNSLEGSVVNLNSYVASIQNYSTEVKYPVSTLALHFSAVGL